MKDFKLSMNSSAVFMVNVKWPRGKQHHNFFFFFFMMQELEYMEGGAFWFIPFSTKVKLQDVETGMCLVNGYWDGHPSFPAATRFHVFDTVTSRIDVPLTFTENSTAVSNLTRAHVGVQVTPDYQKRLAKFKKEVMSTWVYDRDTACAVCPVHLPHYFTVPLCEESFGGRVPHVTVCGLEHYKVARVVVKRELQKRFMAQFSKTVDVSGETTVTGRRRALAGAASVKFSGEELSSYLFDALRHVSS